jgi:hypothetical protein
MLFFRIAKAHRPQAHDTVFSVPLQDEVFRNLSAILLPALQGTGPSRRDSAGTASFLISAGVQSLVNAFDHFKAASQLNKGLLFAL